MDPGITTGIAILDVYGNALNIFSKRNITRGEIINYVLRFGVPVIVASDISVVPKAIEKIATKLGCVVYSPEISPSLNDKRELTKEYYHSLKNDHEVDALSATIKAWKHYRTLFFRVNEVLKRFNRQEIFADVMLKIMREESPNIEDAVREFIEKEETVIREEPRKKDIRQGLLDNLGRKLREKQEEIDALQKQNILLSKALNETRKSISVFKKTKEEIIEPEDYQELKDSVEYIKKFRRIENKGYYPAIELDKITGALVEQLSEMIDLENRVVLVKEKENLNLLNDRNIKCLLVFDEIENSQKEKLEFSVVEIDEKVLENFGDIKAVKIDYIEGKLADAKRSGLIGWLKGYRERRD